MRVAASSVSGPVVVAGTIVLAAFVVADADSSALWWGGAPLVVVAGGVGVAWLLGALAAPQLERAALLVLALVSALVVWAGLSLVWSIAPNLTLGFFNRGLIYVSALVVGLALARVGLDRLVPALGAALAVVLAAGLLTKVVPDLDPEFGVTIATARLKQPLDYANALALLAAFAIPLGVALTTRTRGLLGRLGGSCLTFLALVVVPLTFSRSGLAIAGLVVVLWLWWSGRAFEGLVSLLAAGLPAAVVVGVGFALDGITAEKVPPAIREDDGVVFGLALVVGLVAALGLAVLAPRAARVSERRRAGAVRAALVVVGAVVVVGVVGVVVRAGGPGGVWDEVTASEDFGQGSGRLTQVSSDYRASWWGEAVDGWRDRPLAGSGAGTFKLTHERYRDDSTATTEPHSLPLQLASELGVIGLAFGLALAVAVAVAIRRRVARADVEERDLVLALALVPLAFGLHSLVDFPWEHPGLTVVVFLVVGLLLPSGVRRTRQVLPALAVGVFVLAALYSLIVPWAAVRDIAESTALLGVNPSRALGHADRAVGFDPTSLEALYARARAQNAIGNPQGAERTYREATELQPENAEPWLQLGQFQLYVLNDGCNAWDALNRAYTLDPFGRAGAKGGPKDQALKIRNSGECS